MAVEFYFIIYDHFFFDDCFLPPEASRTFSLLFLEFLIFFKFYAFVWQIYFQHELFQYKNVYSSALEMFLQYFFDNLFSHIFCWPFSNSLCWNSWNNLFFFSSCILFFLSFYLIFQDFFFALFFNPSIEF